MIKTKRIKASDGKTKLLKTYSDAGMYIRAEDSEVLYTEVVTALVTEKNYIETDIPIEKEGGKA